MTTLNRSFNDYVKIAGFTLTFTTADWFQCSSTNTEHDDFMAAQFFLLLIGPKVIWRHDNETTESSDALQAKIQKNLDAV